MPKEKSADDINPTIFWTKMLDIEKRLSRLEIIYYIQLVLWLATLLKLLVG